VVTKSELRVLCSLVQGRSNKQIAEEIFVSEKDREESPESPVQEAGS